MDGCGEGDYTSVNLNMPDFGKQEMINFLVFFGGGLCVGW
jgi:hypothetical protein